MYRTHADVTEGARFWQLPLNLRAVWKLSGLELYTVHNNLFTNCQACLRAEGAYFQHLLKHPKLYYVYYILCILCIMYFTYYIYKYI